MAADPDMEDSFLSGNGIHRILVWLLAGVAGEGLVHRQMIASDPRQAYAFLQMARNRWALSVCHAYCGFLSVYFFACCHASTGCVRSRITRWPDP